MRKDYSNSSNRPTLRRSQTVTTFGVGSIIDIPDASVMTCSIDKWDMKGSVTLSDPRLEKKLGVSYFLMPGDVDSSADGIRTVRFPKWMRCRKCNRIQSLESWRALASERSSNRDFFAKPYCDICGIPLIPSRFVVACRKGHIDDFPFTEWAHGGADVCSNPKISYHERGAGAMLSNIIIRCDSCKKENSMGGSFSREILEKISYCKGYQPWEMKSESCGESLTTLQRGGTNVHFPVIKSSILIPPHKTNDLKDQIRATGIWQIFETADNAIDLEIIVAGISKELEKDQSEIRKTIEEMSGKIEIAPEHDKTEEDYRYEEYRAFLGDYQEDKNNIKDFLIEIKDTGDYNLPFFENIVLAKKLREIRVQVGFSRIRPPQSHDETGGEIPDSDKIEQVPVTSKKRIHWLPGYEVRGEGIFLKLDSKQLQEWSANSSVQERLKKVMARAAKNPDTSGIVENLTPDFVLLHSLAHILIRQLSFECGYSSSALRERIYCSSDQESREMAGILIYTAEGDSDGTLGGLVRQGLSEFLGLTVLKALNEAQWCSSDPLCIESEGQGYQSLNLGACHSCAMLPETSCELFNRYLDRALLIGTPEDQKMGFFSEWLNKS